MSGAFLKMPEVATNARGGHGCQRWPAVISGRIMIFFGHGVGVKIFLKPHSDSDPLFIFGSSRRLSGLCK